MNNQQTLNGLTTIEVNEITTDTIDINEILTTQYSGVKYENINTGLDILNIYTLGENTYIPKNDNLEYRYDFLEQYYDGVNVLNIKKNIYDAYVSNTSILKPLYIQFVNNGNYFRLPSITTSSNGLSFYITYKCNISPEYSSIFSLSNGASSNDIMLYFLNNNLYLKIESYDYLLYDNNGFGLNDGLKRNIVITIYNDINFYIDGLLVNTITNIYYPP
jgi:hypothetical protein